MPLVLVDYPVLRVTSTVTAAPTSFLVECAPVPVRYVWRVDQISVVAFTPSELLSHSPYVLLYDQPPNPLTIPIQGTQMQPWEQVNYGGALPIEQAMFADFDDQGSPLTIRGGDQLIIAFEPAFSVGTVLGARVQYGLYQGTSGQPQPIAGASPAAAIPPGI